jgi:hypothetical protein
MTKTQRFLLWFVGALSVFYVVGSAWVYRLQRIGIELIRKGDIANLEKHVRGRSDLATYLLGYAYEENQRDMFEMLFEHGARVNVAKLQTKWGPFPLLHHFAREDDIYWLKTSFAHGGDPNTKVRFGVTPFSEALDGRKPENAMAAIAAGGDIHGQIKQQTYYDKAVGNLLFEPACKMLEMGLDPTKNNNQFSIAIERIRECCTGIGLDGEDVCKAQENEWFQKILAWYHERDMDIEYATYEPGEKNQPGKWHIPSRSGGKPANTNPR